MCRVDASTHSLQPHVKNILVCNLEASDLLTLQSSSIQTVQVGAHKGNRTT